MQKLKRLVTCSCALTSPTSPPAHNDAERPGDNNQRSAAHEDPRLAALTARPGRPRLRVEPDYAFSLVERRLRERVSKQLLPRINDLVDTFRAHEGEDSIMYTEARVLQDQLQERAQGKLMLDGEPIGGGDELEQAIKGLEDHVEDYFRRNPGITRPTLPPRLPTAGTPVDVDLPSHSVGPLFPVFFLKTPTVTRPGSDAGISDDVMQAALKMVKVHSQTSRSMENEQNVINTRVGNFLRAIWQNERVHMMVVIKAKENKDNVEKLVESLRQLVQSNPNLGRNY
ncbi:hypothetical protein [Xanthomonas vasicola]|uniref:hypothetical protein n=1 Tax=Xanthomonas vasicola TaxID=56459 RepID=UPI0010D5B48E|nr:hypothetical protein [Xanthomonas vasicola]MDO6986008.1 hypothetical protein [Xanthomonas vasicola]